MFDGAEFSVNQSYVAAHAALCRPVGLGKEVEEDFFSAFEVAFHLKALCDFSGVAGIESTPTGLQLLIAFRLHGVGMPADLAKHALGLGCLIVAEHLRGGFLDVECDVELLAGAKAEELVSEETAEELEFLSFEKEVVELGQEHGTGAGLFATSFLEDLGMGLEESGDFFRPTPAQKTVDHAGQIPSAALGIVAIVGKFQGVVEKDMEQTAMVKALLAGAAHAYEFFDGILELVPRKGSLGSRGRGDDGFNERSIQRGEARRGLRGQGFGEVR